MRLTIVEGGNTQYHIVTSQFADNAELYAASQLQHYLYEALNTYIPYFSDRGKKRGKEIYIGRTARDVGKDMDFSNVEEEGFVIRTIGEELLIAGGSPRGTLYGVYAFLEKFLGFRQFNKDVWKIDKKDALFLEEMNWVENPAFEYRDVYSRDAWDISFAVKNRLNGSPAPIPREMGGKMKFFNCHHSFADLVPPQYYAEKHPEYYSQNAGEGTGKQLCLSNPKVYKIALAQLKEWIRDNPECKIFSVAQNDNQGYCRCAKCQKQDSRSGAPSGSIIRFVNRLAREIKKENSDVLLHTFAYNYSRIAPKGIRVEDNVIVRLCNIECERAIPLEQQAKGSEEESGVKTAKEFMQNIRDWSAICKRLYVWDYVVNYSHYLLPLLPLHVFAENIKTYRKYGIQGVLSEGNFSYGGDVNMGDLKNYLLAKLLWNPSLCVDELVEEYIFGVFGKGAPHILAYVQKMEKAVTGTHTHLYDGSNAEYITPTLIEECDELFNLALEAEDDLQIKRRIEREKLAITYLKTVWIEDDELRAQAADELYEKLKAHKVTEIRERTDLRDGIRWIKENRFANLTTNWHSLYYIVR